jgi:hypothetical protein
MNNDIRTFFLPPKSQQIVKTTLNTDDRLPDMSLPMKKLEALLKNLPHDKLRKCLTLEKNRKPKPRKTLCEYINRLLKPSKNCGLKNEELVINRFNTDPEYKKRWCEGLDIDYNDNLRMRKYNNKKDNPVYDKRFKDLKYGTKEVKLTAKTDAIMENVITGEVIYKKSLKTGAGRATSCNYYETKAILICVIENNEYPTHEGNTPLRELVNKTLESMKMCGKHKSIYNKTEIVKLNKKADEKLLKKDKEWLESQEKYHAETNKVWSIIRDQYPKFVLDVIIECYTGKYKYGSNSGSADCLIITKTKSTDIDHIFYPLDSTNPKFVEYCKKYIKNNTNPFAIKSSRSGKTKPYTLWPRFL